MESNNMVAHLKPRLRGMGPWDLFDELQRELGRFFGEPLEQALGTYRRTPRAGEHGRQ